MKAALGDTSDGARIYLVPVALYYGTLYDGGGHSHPVGPGGLRCQAFRFIVRCGEGYLLDQEVPIGSLDAVIADLPAELSIQARLQLAQLTRLQTEITLPHGRGKLAFTKPVLMGVLNITPDSFSDGGDFLDTDAALRHARAMVAAGADIIDVGGESTRPGASPVWEGEEADRVLPVITALAAEGITVSVDSRHASVMQQAVAAGGAILNDVSALSYDGDSMAVAAESSAPVILMHAQGTPATMQDAPRYRDVLFDIYDYLAERIAACEAAGIDRSRLILDPGLGFGKRVVQDNIALMNGLALFHNLGCPLLVGASRKRFIGAVTGVEVARDRVAGSVAAAIKAVEAGVQIVRVHDVADTMQALRMTQAFHDAAMMDFPRCTETGPEQKLT